MEDFLLYKMIPGIMTTFTMTGKLLMSMYHFRGGSSNVLILPLERYVAVDVTIRRPLYPSAAAPLCLFKDLLRASFSHGPPHLLWSSCHPVPIRPPPGVLLDLSVSMLGWGSTTSSIMFHQSVFHQSCLAVGSTVRHRPHSSHLHGNIWSKLCKNIQKHGWSEPSNVRSTDWLVFNRHSW